MILPDPEQIEWDWRGVIYGELHSKANSRKLVKSVTTGKMISIKSAGATTFYNQARLQVRPLPALLEGPLLIWADVFYLDNRKDLDPSVLEDALQGLVYPNDRALVVKIYRRYVDKKSPRAVVRIKRLEP